MHSKAFRKKRSSNYRSIRIDVYAIDSEGNVYDAEMQGKNTGNLPRRSRLYESYINVSLLEAGETDFNKLNDNDVYVIIIAPVDLWGQGKYRYTFRMSCEGRGERRRKRRGQKRRAGKHRTGAKACRGKKTAPNRRKRSWSV